MAELASVEMSDNSLTAFHTTHATARRFNFKGGMYTNYPPENLIRICALFSCSPRGLSSWASFLQSAFVAVSGVG